MLATEGVSAKVCGIGESGPKRMGCSVMEPFRGTSKRSDWPDWVMPLKKQVARARTRPWLTGTLGRTQVPSGFTWMLRLRTLTVQESLSWALARYEPASIKQA